MRIGIDARYVYDHFPGIGRYVYELISALGQLQTSHQFVVIYHPDLTNSRYDMTALGRFPSIELMTTTVQPFHPAEQIRIPQLARWLKLDLLHTPYFIRPYFGLPCPTVLTIYDLIGWRFPELLPTISRRIFPLAMRLALWSSNGLIAISTSARDDLAEAYRVPSDQVTVIPLAADAAFTPQSKARMDALRTHYDLPARYVLYLGANKPHKNLERLVGAWEQVSRQSAVGSPTGNCQLIIAGHYDPRYSAMEQLVAKRGLHDRVRFLRNVAAADLPALYAAATIFAFPSFYEGFGLPPLEAMACGTPVLCANTSSMPEVVGDAALLVEPYDEAAIARGLRRLLGDEALRSDLSARGIERARAFSWERTARETLAVYERMARSANKCRGAAARNSFACQ